jgi:2',3'-cyclic-nucleotide 2'-phosphodiesterase / 3'-nucleotidase
MDRTLPRRHPALLIALTLALSFSLVWPAAAQPKNPRAIANHTAELTVMATSDLHGYALNWDYFNDRPFTSNEPGLSKIATSVEQVRADRGEDATLLIDNGDTIQGSMLAQYWTKVEPFNEVGVTHPMALAMNDLGYDAMVVGNHEFNFGVPFLRDFEDQIDFPLLGANVRDADTGAAAFEPYTMHRVNLKGHKPINVGILGLTTPGSAIWDRDKVEGILDFEDGVATAATYVPQMRAAGADLVIVLAHSGITPGSSYGDAIPYLENFSGVLAETVPGIDAIVAGHSHRAVPEQYITNTTTGEDVLLTQPASWGRNLSVMDFELQKVRGQWEVTDKAGALINSTGVPEHAGLTTLIQPYHDAAVTYVNAPIGTSLAEMSMAEGRYRDVAALDLVNHVQVETVRDGVAGTSYEGMPILSIAAPFNRDAVIPEGQVSVRDIAGIYIYDNTLIAIEMTGQQLVDYLEFSAGYFSSVDNAGPMSPDALNTTKPDYNYDVVFGLDYDIDLGQPYGSRIENVTFEGAALDLDASFVVALNNYRQNGGGGFPHVAAAPIVYNPLVEIRETIIEWVESVGVIDPAEFHTVDWQLVYDGTPIEIVP